MLRRETLRRLLQKALWLKVVVALSLALLLAVDFTSLAHAAFPNLFEIVAGPITVQYPTVTGNSLTVRGTGRQVVYRLDNRQELGAFPPGPACQNLMFIEGSLATVNENDFVYAIQVEYEGSPTAPMDTLQVGYCANPGITSISYCQDQGVPPSPGGVNKLSLALDVFFNSPSIISKPFGPGSSAILFYTSPYPPDLVPTFIGSSAVASQGIVPGTTPPAPPQPVQSPIFGPCKAIEILKKPFCVEPNGVVREVPDGVPVNKKAPMIYKFTVTNTATRELINVVLKDSKLPDFPERHLPNIPPGGSHMETKEIPGDKLPLEADGTFTNMATVEADYVIPTQDGNPSLQTVRVSASSTARVKIVETGGLCELPTPPCKKICFRPPGLCQIFLDMLPTGTIIIGGVNFNNPVNIKTNSAAIRNALFPCPAAVPNCTLSPLQQLNQQYVAAQLSLAYNGGVSSAVAMNVLWSTLGCYPELAAALPVTLSNGVTLTSNSMLKELFEQARLAIIQNRTADMVKLANLLKLLNSCTKI